MNCLSCEAGSFKAYEDGNTNRCYGKLCSQFFFANLLYTKTRNCEYFFCFYILIYCMCCNFGRHNGIHHHHLLPDAPASPCASYVSSDEGTFAAGKTAPQCASCATGYTHFADGNVCVSKYHTHYIIADE